MDIVVIIFLWLSLLFYLVLGGADFGAGIIELFTSGKNRDSTRTMVYNAIGPIWEANHMWLIIAIVILFVGFPAIYSEMSVYLHIPLLIMLFGIIARGTAFMFRHYDAIQDELQHVYNRIFVLSSFVTPLFLGIIAGSAISMDIDHNANSFSEAYIFSWLSWFSLSVGIFTVAICGFLAAVYLIGEAHDEQARQRFITKARYMNILAVVSGGLVFVASLVDGIPLIEWILKDFIGLMAVILATFSLWLLWTNIKKRKKWLPRILAGFQVSMIVLSITYAHFPDFILVANGENLSLFKDQAPPSTMNALGWALMLGSLFILPALFYLMYSFQKPNQSS
jgi:cytochrome d ubiquinol oxidase subunit II